MKLEARITSIVGGEKLKAFASILVDGWLLIKGFRVIDGINGRFVAMPSRKTKAGEFIDVCYSIVKEGKEELETAILNEYAKKVEEM